MDTWIYFLHPTRPGFSPDAMTDAEIAAWTHHFERFKRLLTEGTVVLVGPTLGDVNIGIAIIEAPDEATARRIMDEDPTIAAGHARGELQPFRISLIRGRDAGTSWPPGSARI
jgi:uncharacterized protein YciI